MPYVNKPRPYKHEYEMQKKRGENPARMERQRARRELDKEGVSRKGMDVSHVKALSRGGDNSDGVTLQTPSENRSFKRTKKSGYKDPIDKPKGKRVYKV